MQQIIVIIINPSKMLELVIALATLVKKLGTFQKIHVITAEPEWFKNDTLATDFDVMKKRVYNNQDFDPLIYLLDIGPDEFELNDLLSFNERYSAKIMGWIGRGWDEESMKEINRHGGVLKSLSKDEPLTCGVSELGFSVRPYLIEDDKTLSSGDIDLIMSNSSLSRIFKAVKVAESISTNTGNDALLATVVAGAYEVLSGLNQKIISDLAQKWEEMQALTEKALQAINEDFFSQAKKNNRPIAYINIGRVPDFINLEDILTRTLDKYPYLAIVEAKIEGCQSICLASHKLPQRFMDKLDRKSVV